MIGSPPRYGIELYEGANLYRIWLLVNMTGGDHIIYTNALDAKQIFDFANEISTFVKEKLNANKIST